MKSRDPFLQELELRAKEQARIAQSSRLPQVVRPFAALFGERSWQMLLGISFILAGVLATWSFRFLYMMYEKGVLQWLVR
ncbi:hypothetical protein C5B42_01870 [Candidatus Cerribacteria bacterium 'Amazon FNV 2010 28 9']|uniref:Uncharacterized protein n=1 Tax=Candidatus Cerribacteria bacterium 'Amazon FNV 2010 28 9' TaxID=2081795 RepID=A0A317JTE2_9BACT|nr:MAG: hypothetical protein C5B42_01870 [Candidatus Cerribacteria bacterium 'Amazon FNV 2010 28 9']